MGSRLGGHRMQVHLPPRKIAKVGLPGENSEKTNWTEIVRRTLQKCTMPPTVA